MPLPVAQVAQMRTVRLVTSGRLKPPVLAELVDDEAELAAIANLEMLTSARARAQHHQVALDVDPAELLTQSQTQYGWTYVNAAFCYTRATGNRFNGPQRGAWYASFEVETAQAEVAFHLTRELEATNCFVNETDYAELLADFIGPFHDARGLPAGEGILHPDPGIGYPQGQGLAADLRARDSNGIVYPSLRNPGGTCLACFKPICVQNVTQGGLWRMVWRGGREPEISRVGSVAG
ncbi:RES family NAD+ phosphorylase [Breoghania sp. L-A4]|uniref:RES family NAD+ phosphorylase n=1 Tax=Breoghania sp. L-A4 TaxID=2304600 RepID=UPI000E358688|nr:RES family NAD+ phosphorylase [Breoghania sp. L-A4]AXS39567.1 RES domain-containing protein [Breoghania sp. L-A4]